MDLIDQATGPTGGAVERHLPCLYFRERPNRPKLAASMIDATHYLSFQRPMADPGSRAVRWVWANLW